MEKIVIIILAAVVFALLIALSRALEAMWRYKQRVFELTNGREGSNLPRVSDAPPPPRGTQRLKVDTLSRKPKQNLYEDDVIYIDDLRQVKSIMREEEKE